MKRFLLWLEDKLRDLEARFPRWFEVREIMDREGKSLYLTRFHILSSQRSRFSLMLHHMHRPDDDHCHHDHPWPFVTLILWGGYWERVTRQRPEGAHSGAIFLHGGEQYIGPGVTDGTYEVARWNRPGRIRFNRAEHTHRISALPAGECWTLVFRLPKIRSWGFHTTQGFVPWRDFINMRRAFGILWCGRDEE